MEGGRGSGMESDGEDFQGDHSLVLFRLGVVCWGIEDLLYSGLVQTSGLLWFVGFEHIGSSTSCR